MNNAHTYLFLKFNMINFISVFHKAVIEIKKSDKYIKTMDEDLYSFQKKIVTNCKIFALHR